MSSDQALAKNFDVSSQIVTETKRAVGAPAAEMEDLVVDSDDLAFDRDRDLAETQPPRDVNIGLALVCNTSASLTRVTMLERFSFGSRRIATAP